MSVRPTRRNSGTTNQYAKSVLTARRSFHQYMPGLQGVRRARTPKATASPATQPSVSSQESLTQAIQLMAPRLPAWSRTREFGPGGEDAHAGLYRAVPRPARSPVPAPRLAEAVGVGHVSRYPGAPVAVGPGGLLSAGVFAMILYLFAAAFFFAVSL